MKAATEISLGRIHGGILIPGWQFRDFGLVGLYREQAWPHKGENWSPQLPAHWLCIISSCPSTHTKQSLVAELRRGKRLAFCHFLEQNEVESFCNLLFVAPSQALLRGFLHLL